MTRQNRKISKLDSKAAAVLAAGRMSDEEVERIASGPHMMASVWSRIEAEKVAIAAEPAIAAARPFIFGWRTAFATVAILIVAAASMVVFMRSGKQPSLVTQAPEQKFGNTPSGDVSPPVIRSVDFPHDTTLNHDRPRIEHAVFRPEPRKAVQRVREAKQTSLPPPPPLEFYTLPAVQATADAVKDARIVRVELPRASLVALGANIPLEGDKQLVRADLLVGPDGVPRAIRLAD